MLTMTQIRKSFGGIEVLHGVDFTVEPGQVHALVGHNGAGKSTLMKVLGGMYPDYSGSLSIDGELHELRVPRASLDAGVAIIYQDFALVPDLDAAHNIALGREPLAGGGLVVPHRSLVRRSAAEADRFGIRIPLHKPVRELGVADQQLTEIVRALARDCRYLVMDEPTARLAPAERRHLFTIIKSLAQQGVGVVYISHFLDEVVEVADVVTVLRDGQVVFHEPASQCTPDGLATELVGEEGERVHAVLERRPETTSPDAPVRLDVRALHVGDGGPVSFEVRGGEILALAGLVGSGRTRLARAVVGDLKVPGSVAVDGRTLRRRNPGTSTRAGLLFLPEDRKRNGLVLTGTMRDNVELTALGTSLGRWGLVRRRAVDRLVDALVARFAIRPAKPQHIVRNLSGGNAQKVLFARQVAAEPKVIILDQPTAGVDVGAKAELHAQVDALARSGTAVVLISDDLDEMLELATRVLVVTAGRITHELDPATLTRAELLSAMSRKAEEQ